MEKRGFTVEGVRFDEPKTQFPVDGRRADLAVFLAGSKKPLLIVETKRKEKKARGYARAVRSIVDQALLYAIYSGAPYFAVTDGMFFALFRRPEAGEKFSSDTHRILVKESITINEELSEEILITLARLCKQVPVDVTSPGGGLTEAEKKDLEELFEREMALRGLPLKTERVNYLDLFRAYLERWKMVDAKRIKEKRIPILIAAIEEALEKETPVSPDIVTSRIQQAEAKFRVGDYVNYEGKNFRVLEVVEIDGTGRYSYRLEGVEGLVDEALLREVKLPKPKFNVGDKVMFEGKGWVVISRRFDFNAQTWIYDLKPVV